ncbi:MAG: MaoC family dehydratase N-terminal domain-containing protein [Pseudomonadota bacterium]
MRQRKLIGTATETRTIEIDRSDIRNFALAIGAKNPVHHDEAAASKAGYPGLVAPSSMAASLGQHDVLISLLEVHAKNVLHSEQTIEQRRPLLAGDAIKVFSIITDVQERPIGSATTGFVTIEDRGVDTKGKPLFTARRVLAIRGGFPRR